MFERKIAPERIFQPFRDWFPTMHHFALLENKDTPEFRMDIQVSSGHRRAVEYPSSTTLKTIVAFRVIKVDLEGNKCSAAVRQNLHPIAVGFEEVSGAIAKEAQAFVHPGWTGL